MDALHLVVGKGEVEGLDVFLDIVRIRGTRDDREAHLHVPPNDDLCRTLTIAVINAIKLNISYFIVVFVLYPN